MKVELLRVKKIKKTRKKHKERIREALWGSTLGQGKMGNLIRLGNKETLPNDYGPRKLKKKFIDTYKKGHKRKAVVVTKTYLGTVYGKIGD